MTTAEYIRLNAHTVQTPEQYLKAQTEALIKNVGIAEAARLSNRSRKRIKQYFADSSECEHRFIPIDVVAAIEAKAERPYVSLALAELNSAFSAETKPVETVNQTTFQVSGIAQDFALVMANYFANDQTRPLSRNEVTSLFASIIEFQSSLDAFEQTIKMVYRGGCGFE